MIAGVCCVRDRAPRHRTDILLGMAPGGEVSGGINEGKRRRRVRARAVFSGLLEIAPRQLRGPCAVRPVRFVPRGKRHPKGGRGGRAPAERIWPRVGSRHGGRSAASIRGSHRARRSGRHRDPQTRRTARWSAGSTGRRPGPGNSSPRSDRTRRVRLAGFRRRRPPRGWVRFAGWVRRWCRARVRSAGRARHPPRRPRAGQEGPRRLPE